MPGRVWTEVELPADVDWQPAADESPTGDIRETVPEGGHYRKERPKNQGGEWLIGGGLRVNRQLSDDEVSEILRQAGDPEAAEKERQEPKQAADVPHVFLTGSPGAGKTTAAPDLAKQLGMPYEELDALPPEQDDNYPGTVTLQKRLQRWRKPRVLEGVQVMGLPAEEMANRRVLFLDPSEEELANRLVQRGWADSTGVTHQGEPSRQEAEELVSHFQTLLAEFKKRAPHAEELKQAEDRPIIVAVDLDGTLAEEAEDFDPEVIGDPRPGAAKWVQEFADSGAKIIIHTCRDADDLVREWAKEHGVHVDYVNENPWQPPNSSDKLFADVYVDNRGVRATGPWSKVGPQVLKILKAASSLPDLYDEIDSNISSNVEKLAETPYWQRGILAQLQQPVYDPQAGLLSNIGTNVAQARQKAKDQINDRDAALNLMSAMQPGFALQRFQRYIRGGDHVQDPVDQALFRSTT